MLPISVLQNPAVVPSVVLACVLQHFGEACLDWEPDSWYLILSQVNVQPTPALMAKLLGAITIKTTTTWVYDHTVVFAFALACEGVSANGDLLQWPTPEQLCWGVSEITAITSTVFTEDEGFDPDTIDPAVAVLLQEHGYYLTPEPLHFAQDKLDALNEQGQVPATLVKTTQEAWQTLRQLPLSQLLSEVEQLDDDQPEHIQIKRLVDCHAHVKAWERIRAEQHVKSS